jgi:hypothetical protein
MIPSIDAPDLTASCAAMEPASKRGFVASLKMFGSAAHRDKAHERPFDVW